MPGIHISALSTAPGWVDTGDKPRHDRVANVGACTAMSMSLFTLAELEAAVPLVRTVVPATPLYAWPLLAKRTGAEVWVKHENHTPIGAFKMRGGIVYLDAPEAQRRARQWRRHGDARQSWPVDRAGRRRAPALPCAIFVPHGNSREKNAAMQAFGAELIVAGADFDESREHAANFADERGYHFVPSFHADLVKGVATYALEMFTAKPDLDAVYVPIGMGSGICGLITARDLLGLDTEIIGVVAENAPAVALSFEQGRTVPTNSASTFADGMACRVPHEEALAIIRRARSASCVSRGRDRRGHARLLRGHPQRRRGCRRRGARGPACRSATACRASASAWC